ncbi:12255_t:CDS:1, partial [Racocetra persica]
MPDFANLESDDDSQYEDIRKDKFEEINQFNEENDKTEFEE